MSSSSDELNRQVAKSISLSTYVAVKVIVLYWEAGDHGFKAEGEKLAQLFQDEFEYSTECFAIPSSNSQLKLDIYIKKALLAVQEQADVLNGASMLIIHYGGHADCNAGRGEEKRSVWAAHAVGGPTLEWFRIQDELSCNANSTDIVVILDCCYAAQAGRNRLERQPQLELLAAAAMGMQTPLPGNRSFTMALIRELKERCKHKTPVTLPDLHAALVSRKAQLWATPVYVKVHPSPRQIKLEPLRHGQSLERDSNSQAVFLELIIGVERQLEQADIGDLAQWLGADMPKLITSVEVKEVLETTAKIQNFIVEPRSEGNIVQRTLGSTAFDEVLTAWNNVVHLLEKWNAHPQERRSGVRDLEQIRQRAIAFLQQLDSMNTECLDTLERNLLQSPNARDEDLLCQLIDDPSAKAFGIVDQLRLRQIAQATPGSMQSEALQPQTGQSHHLREYKHYGQYINPADMPALIDRMRQLSKMLGMPKSNAFLSLQFLHWYHEELDHRFVMEFAIPEESKTERGTYLDLTTIIRNIKGGARPTLDERFRIAYLLAKAVEKGTMWAGSTKASTDPISYFFPPHKKIE